MSGLIRAFVAVEISDAARRQIAGLLDRLRRDAHPGIRWVKPELMHLTLAFLGEVSSDFLESARDRLAEAAGHHRAFTMQLKTLGAFPSPSRARVAWIGTDQGRDEVCALQRDVVKALGSVGHEPERRSFSPHLTIGRLRIPEDIGKATAVQFESEPFRIEHLVLFRSVLGPGGPTYHRLAEFPLQLD